VGRIDFGTLLLVALAVFFGLFALDALTNVEVVWMRVLMGIAAAFIAVLAVAGAFRRPPL
jgi:hypothetical protein